MLFLLLGLLGIAALAHLAPFPFVLDWVSRDVAMWRVPQPEGGRTVYLTFDDGPNPEATPALLDLLRRERVRATFFLIDRHLTPETAPIVRRMAAEGHGIALHSHTRKLMVMSPDALDRTLDAAADRLEALAGVRPCPAFRPHGGGRSLLMIAGLRQSRRRLIGWGMFLWDWDWFRPRRADRLASRIGRRAGPGSIIVLHDGHHKDPRPDRRYAIETTARLIPMLRERGLEFGSICEVVE
jgi:peptidoglycan/xylan/chitin deacetylase (PgdA/CDA1 family)